MHSAERLTSVLFSGRCTNGASLSIVIINSQQSAKRVDRWSRNRPDQVAPVMDVEHRVLLKTGPPRQLQTSPARLLLVVAITGDCERLAMRRFFCV